MSLESGRNIAPPEVYNQPPSEPERKKGDLVSLAQVNEIYPQYQFNIGLPMGMDPHQVMVDIDRIHELTTWSGIGTLHVQTTKLNNEDAGQVGGINPDGSASMASVQTSMQTSQSDGEYDVVPANVMHTTRQVNGKIDIDLQRIMGERTKLQPLDQIAKGLDRGVRKEIAAIGIKNLLRTNSSVPVPTVFNGLADGTRAGLFVVTMSRLADMGINPENAGNDLRTIIGLTAYEVFWQWWSRYTAQIVLNTEYPKQRLSLIPGYPIDRAAVLYLDCMLNRGIVKSTKKGVSR